MSPHPFPDNSQRWVPIPGRRDQKGRQLGIRHCSCGNENLVRKEAAYYTCSSCVNLQSKGFPAGVLVDEEFRYLEKWSWSLNNAGYATASIGELHRIVMGLKRGDGLEVGHKNDNKLDCRKENLGIISHQLNNQQKWDGTPPSKRFTSQTKTGIVGVCWYRKTSKWRATTATPQRHLGFFHEFFEACCARKSWENKHG